MSTQQRSLRGPILLGVFVVALLGAAALVASWTSPPTGSSVAVTPSTQVAASAPSTVGTETKFFRLTFTLPSSWRVTESLPDDGIMTLERNNGQVCRPDDCPRIELHDKISADYQRLVKNNALVDPKKEDCGKTVRFSPSDKKEKTQIGGREATEYHYPACDATDTFSRIALVVPGSGLLLISYPDVNGNHADFQKELLVGATLKAL